MQTVNNMIFKKNFIQNTIMREIVAVMPITLTLHKIVYCLQPVLFFNLFKNANSKQQNQKTVKG